MSSSGFKNSRDRSRLTVPLAGFVLQRFPAALGQQVVLGTAVVLCRAPSALMRPVRSIRLKAGKSDPGSLEIRRC